MAYSDNSNGLVNMVVLNDSLPIKRAPATQKVQAAPMDFAAHVAAAPQKALAPYREFETFMLQHFIENMFPAKNETVFGKGQSGQIWKSFLADAIAKEMSKAGGLGLAPILMAKHEK